MKVVDARDPQTYAVIGAAMEIHRQLGHGFLEGVYQDAAVIEFTLGNIPFQREVTLPVKYKDNILPTHSELTLSAFRMLWLNSRQSQIYRTSKRRRC
jgi:GxxExxY protein